MYFLENALSPKTSNHVCTGSLSISTESAIKLQIQKEQYDISTMTKIEKHKKMRKSFFPSVCAEENFSSQK
jgi:hypothetical protein